MAMKFWSGVGALLIVAAIADAAPPSRNTRRPTTQKTAPRTTTQPATKKPYPKAPVVDAPGSVTPKTVTPSTKPGNGTFAPPPLPANGLTPPQPKREEDAAAPTKIEIAPVADAPGSVKTAIPHPAVAGEVKVEPAPTTAKPLPVIAPPRQSVAATVAPDANGKYLFRYHFSNGETIRWKAEHRAKIVTSVQGSTQTAETVTISTKAWRVVETLPGGETKFQHVVESIDMRQKLTGRQEVSYNSETDTDVPPIFADAAKQIGVPLSEVTIDVRGNIVARSEKSLGKTMTVVLPDVPLAIGEVWTLPMDFAVNDTNGVPKSLKGRRKLTLEKVEGNLATLKYDTQILSPLNDPAVEAQLILEHIEQSGSVAFDLGTGRIVAQISGLDREVFGFQGPESKLHYVTQYTETLVAGAAAKTAETTDANPLR